MCTGKASTRQALEAFVPVMRRLRKVCAVHVGWQGWWGGPRVAGLVRVARLSRNCTAPRRGMFQLLGITLKVAMFHAIATCPLGLAIRTKQKHGSKPIQMCLQCGIDFAYLQQIDTNSIHYLQILCSVCFAKSGVIQCPWSVWSECNRCLVT